jgi:hypothetical protein
MLPHGAAAKVQSGEARPQPARQIGSRRELTFAGKCRKEIASEAVRASSASGAAESEFGCWRGRNGELQSPGITRRIVPASLTV